MPKLNVDTLSIALAVAQGIVAVESLRAEATAAEKQKAVRDLVTTAVITMNATQGRQVLNLPAVQDATDKATDALVALLNVVKTSEIKAPGSTPPVAGTR